MSEVYLPLFQGHLGMNEHIDINILIAIRNKST